MHVSKVRSCSTASKLFSSLALVVTLANLLLTGFVLLRLKTGTPQDVSYFRNGTAHSLPIEIGKVALTLEDSEHYQVLSPSAWGEWDSLTPNGGGWIYLGSHFEHKKGLAMFHQLHCLDSLREAWFDKPRNNKHVQHCFNYLREVILCLSDTTLEPFTTLSDGHKGGNGLGVTHVCRDWSKVYEYAEKNNAEYVAYTARNTTSTTAPV